MVIERFRKLSAAFLAFIMVFMTSGVFSSSEEKPGKDPGIVRETVDTIERAKELTDTLHKESKIFEYVDEVSFSSAQHIERLTEQEDLNTYVFRNTDGTTSVYYLNEAVKFVNNRGTLVEKDLTLTRSKKGYETARNNIQLLLPERLSSGVMLTSSIGEVTLTPLGATSLEITSLPISTDPYEAIAEIDEAVEAYASVNVQDNAANYPDVFGSDTLLRYTPTLSGVKEDIVLASYNGKNSFVFALYTGELSVFEDENGYYIAANEDSNEKIRIGNIIAYDALGSFEMGSLRIIKNRYEEKQFFVVLGVSSDYLTSPDTVYPVIIDPTLKLIDSNAVNNVIQDAVLYSGKNNDNYENINFANYLFNDIGSTNHGSAWTAVRFPYLYDNRTMPLEHNLVDSVQFYVREASGTAAASVGVYPITTSWTETTATYSNIVGSGNYTTKITTNTLSNSSWAAFNVTSYFQTYEDRTPADKGFLLRVCDYGTNEPYKQFCSSEYSSYRPYLLFQFHPYIYITGGSNRTVLPCKSIQLSYMMLPDYPEATIEWHSENDMIADVSENGLVTGCIPGTTRIWLTATYVDDLNAITTYTSNQITVTVQEQSLFIENAHNCKFLGAQVNGTNGNNANVDDLMQEYYPKWTITYIASGDYYTLFDTTAEMYLGVDSIEAGAIGKMYTTNSDAKTHWKLYKRNNLQFSITPIECSDYTLVLKYNNKKAVLNNYVNDSNYLDEWKICSVLDVAIFDYLDYFTINSVDGNYMAGLQYLKNTLYNDSVNLNATNGVSYFSGGIEKEKLIQRIKDARVIIIFTHGNMTAPAILIESPTKPNHDLRNTDLYELGTGYFENTTLAFLFVCYSSTVYPNYNNDSFQLALSRTMANGAGTVVATPDTQNAALNCKYCCRFFRYWLNPDTTYIVDNKLYINTVVEQCFNQAYFDNWSVVNGIYLSLDSNHKGVWNW